MPHFVVSEFNGVRGYAVEFFRGETHEGYTPPAPIKKVIAAIEIPDCVAALPLDTLISMYRDGVRPRAQSATIEQQQQLPHVSNPQLAMG